MSVLNNLGAKQSDFDCRADWGLCRDENGSLEFELRWKAPGSSGEGSGRANGDQQDPSNRPQARSNSRTEYLGSAAPASDMTAFTIDVRRLFHRLALGAAIFFPVSGRAAAVWMSASLVCHRGLLDTAFDKPASRFAKRSDIRRTPENGRRVSRGDA